MNQIRLRANILLLCSIAYLCKIVCSLHPYIAMHTSCVQSHSFPFLSSYTFCMFSYKCINSRTENQNEKKIKMLQDPGGHQPRGL